MSWQAFETHAEEYHKAARLLLEVRSNGQNSPIFEAPLLNLLAHALELYLKSFLLKLERAQSEVEKYRHDIHRLFNSLSGDNETRQWVEDLRKRTKCGAIGQVKEHPNAILERANLDVTDENVELLGLATNQEIGSEIPTLDESILWLSNLHNDGKGGALRYRKTKLIQVPILQKVHTPAWPLGIPLFPLILISSCDVLRKKIRFEPM